MTSKTRSTVKAGVSGSASGTTIDDYAAGLAWECLGYLSKRVLIKNTGGSNALKFKVISHYSSGGVDVTEKSETVLTNGNSWASTTELEHACNDIAVYVAANVGASQTTYTIEYTGLAPGK
jgi:hypothetical protein